MPAPPLGMRRKVCNVEGFKILVKHSRYITGRNVIYCKTHKFAQKNMREKCFWNAFPCNDLDMCKEKCVTSFFFFDLLRLCYYSPVVQCKHFYKNSESKFYTSRKLAKIMRMGFMMICTKISRFSRSSRIYLIIIIQSKDLKTMQTWFF